MLVHGLGDLGIGCQTKYMVSVKHDRLVKKSYAFQSLACKGPGSKALLSVSGVFMEL